MALLVNDEPVEDDVIEREAASMQRRLRNISQQEIDARRIDPAVLEKHRWDWSRDNVIERTLLRQEALKDTEVIPPEAIEKALEERKQVEGAEDPFAHFYSDDDPRHNNIETRVRLDRLFARITGKVSPPKNKEIAEFYRKNKTTFWMPEMVRAAHIVKNVDEKTGEAAARAAIESVQQQLSSGVSFEELADQHSDCPGNGGDLGYFARGQMVEEFDEAVFALVVGEISSIFRSAFGFHIAKLVDRREPALIPLSDVQGTIQRKLLQDKQVRAIENFVDQLRGKADISGLPAGAGSVTRKQ